MEADGIPVHGTRLKGLEDEEFEGAGEEVASGHGVSSLCEVRWNRGRASDANPLFKYP
jgi:hypothetical protein